MKVDSTGDTQKHRQYVVRQRYNLHSPSKHGSAALLRNAPFKRDDTSADDALVRALAALLFAQLGCGNKAANDVTHENDKGCRVTHRHTA